MNRHFLDARGRQSPRLHRWMMFVDGEGLAIRSRELLRVSDFELASSARYERDVFVWLGNQGVPRQVFKPISHAPLEEFALRWHYYTALQGDDVKRDAVRDALHQLGFDAHVIKKTAKKSKGVDITLARDLLSNAYRDNFDAAVLIAGDADFVPLVEEVKRLGKQVYVLFFASQGLGEELRRHSDEFFDFDDEFRNSWMNSPNCRRITPPA